MCFGKKQNAFSVSSVELQKNEEIDKMIRKDRKRMKKEIKILLLGAGESGKSTILKQMKILHANGFSIDERREIRPIIFSNLIVAFKIIIDEMSTLEIGFQNQESERFEAIILVTEDIGPDDPFPMECLPAMKGLWADSGVQTAIKRGNEYALHDNLTYFFGNIDRLFARDYMPNDQDMLRSRLRTTGITETVFELGELTYHMFDVGGQRSERKKWIHCFEGVQCLMFLVALSGYDQCLVEDKAANQMQEAIMLFESIVNTSWFKRSSIILFLNKVDLFKEKLEVSPVKDYFPDFQGANDDFDAACQFFADKFRDLNRNREKEIYIHFTNATDTNLLKVTMQSVQDMIIQNNLNNLIL